MSFPCKEGVSKSVLTWAAPSAVIIALRLSNGPSPASHLQSFRKQISITPAFLSSPVSISNLAHLRPALVFRISPLLIQENFGNNSMKWEALYMLFQFPMAIENGKSATLSRKMWWNKLISIHIIITHLPQVLLNVRSAGPDFRVLRRQEGEAASKSRISPPRGFRVNEKAVGSWAAALCFLTPPCPPCFQVYPESLQTKLIRALRAFKQSKMWPFVAAASIHEWGSLDSRGAISDVLGDFNNTIIKDWTSREICFSCNTWSNKSPKRAEKTFFLKSVFEIHFSSLVGTCQSNSYSKKMAILTKKQVRKNLGFHSSGNQCFHML